LGRKAITRKRRGKLIQEKKGLEGRQDAGKRPFYERKKQANVGKQKVREGVSRDHLSGINRRKGKNGLRK